MAQPGTKVVVHEKQNNRLSWAGHGTNVWYIGPSLEHYRCFKCYMLVTCRERDADTVEFSLTTTPFPHVSTDDYLRQAATDLVNILCALKNNIPPLTYGSPTTNAYIHISQILKRSDTSSTNLPSVHNETHSPIVMQVLPRVTKETSLVPATTHINKTVLRKHVAAEPRVKHKT